MRSSRSRTADTNRPLAWLTVRPFAHRGLHNPTRPENSCAAFAAAIAAGNNIELDAQASRDGIAMVFHDASLERMTHARGPIKERTAAELIQITLKRTHETIPTLDAVLHLIAGRAVLLIELKGSGPGIIALCQSVRQSLQNYPGKAAIMSFNPKAVRWFARHAPKVTRGLVVSEEGKKGLWGKLERRLSLWWAVPDFLAYDIHDLPSRFASAARKQGLPILSWTICNGHDKDKAAVHADQIIHELPQQR